MITTERTTYYALAKVWNDDAEQWVTKAIDYYNCGLCESLEDCVKAVAELREETDVQWVEYHKRVTHIEDETLNVKIKR